MKNEKQVSKPKKEFRDKCFLGTHSLFVNSARDAGSHRVQKNWIDRVQLSPCVIPEKPFSTCLSWKRSASSNSELSALFPLLISWTISWTFSWWAPIYWMKFCSYQENRREHKSMFWKGIKILSAAGRKSAETEAPMIRATARILFKAWWIVIGVRVPFELVGYQSDNLWTRLEIGNSFESNRESIGHCSLLRWNIRNSSTRLVFSRKGATTT